MKKETQEAEEQEDEQEKSAEEEESIEKEEEIEATQKKAAPSTHHLNRRCVVPSGCKGYEGPNLKHHLKNVHVRKNNILDKDVDRYFAMGLHGTKKRGPPGKQKQESPSEDAGSSGVQNQTANTLGHTFWNTSRTFIK